jgi:hypothetical protein
VGWAFEKIQNERTTSSRYSKTFRIQQPPSLSILEKKNRFKEPSVSDISKMSMNHQVS